MATMTTTTISPTLTVGDTMWTDSTTIADPIFWMDAKTGVVNVVEKPKDTVTLRAQARVNKTTIKEKQLTEVMATVKHKLLKQLFEQLEKSGAVKIVSVPSDKTGSITFHASLELVQNDAKA